MIQPPDPLEPVPRLRAAWHSKFPETPYGYVFNLLIFFVVVVVPQPLYNVFFLIYYFVMSCLSIAAILVILPTVFIADLFCESCTLMFHFMSKSKYLKKY